jgi:uncharacterized protein (TIGR02118 family)
VTNRDGITRVFIARRRPDLSIEEFQRYWRNEHATITLTFPDINRYVQNHAVLRNGVPWLPWPGFDVFSELDFDSADAMDSSWSSPEYAKGEDDENNFMDPRWSTVLVGVRHRIGDAAPPRFRLVWLCSGAPIAGAARTLDEPTIVQVAERILAATGGSSVAAVVATPELLERYPPRDFPTILWVGFDDLARLRSVMRGVLDVVLSDLGRNEHDATVVVEPNIVIGTEA